jgi:hypothetical protein
LDVDTCVVHYGFLYFRPIRTRLDLHKLGSCRLDR